MKISTPELCDSHPGSVRIVEPVFKNYGAKTSFGGEVVTIKCFEDNSRVKENAAVSGKGKVMVVDGGGSLNKALLGDLIAETALNNGWEGFIIYGCIRDVEPINTMQMGVKALNSIPLKTERKGVDDLNIPVTFAGVTFEPGDFVYCDETGIIVSKEPL